MPRERFGLFDTPPSRREVRLSLAIVALQFAVVVAILPVQNVHLGIIQAFVPTIDAIVVTGELIIGTLLLAQAAVFRSRSLNALGSGYVISALLLIPHALTFPGAFSETGLLDAKVNTTAWIMTFQGCAFPIAVTRYALLKRADLAKPEGERPPVRVFGEVLGVILLTVSLTLLATVGHDLLPPLFVNDRDAVLSNVTIVNVATIVLTVAAIVLLFLRKKSVLDVWLLVALFGWLFQTSLNAQMEGRFTFGWYCTFGIMLTASLIVMLALIAESNRLHSRLVLSAAAKERDYEARLTAMGGVAAAIAHEVAQPLAAVTMNARGGLNWLNRDIPNPAKASEALEDTLDAAHRALDVISSLRATFGKGSGTDSEFGANDLVRETTSLFERDLAAQTISLQLALDDTLPAVLADRVQIQRVLVNLLTNAIEAMAETRNRARRIVIRSTRTDGETLLLEVKDSGAGIAPEKLDQIFEPLFTTKSNGTGLGLTLSRSIIEDHGGRLWASTSDSEGATIHLELPLPSPPDIPIGSKGLPA